MERREFLAAGAALAQLRMADFGLRIGNQAGSPALPPEVFARRLERARAELAARSLDLLLATPSTNYHYLTGYNPGRSERLIALLVPTSGDPAIVCPAFEVERVRRNSVIRDVQGWEEHEDPYRLVRETVRRMRGRGTAALEPSTEYHTSLRLAAALPTWTWVDASPVTERLRILKAPEELTMIRRAIEITEAAIAATFAQLSPGQTEREVAQLLSREMQQRGAAGGGGLVQFGPSSALPHGGPGGGRLARQTVVLIDGGCRVGGYTSDITRTIWFGDAPPEEFKKVFNLVHDAQTAALELGRPRVTACQDLDRAARAVITDAGYGKYFTHRLGHGMGMDGHEVPYLVEGNTLVLEPGMVFSNEPGIYQLGSFGVRIEDDCVMTERGIEVLSTRPAKL